MAQKIAIFISGRGSNMEKLVEACGSADFPADVVGVLADKPDAAGLDFAAQAGLATAMLARGAYADKPAHEAAILSQLEQWGADIVCLAGFMRLLSGDFISDWGKPIINIHPSLLPLYPGLDTHKRALSDGVKLHGCTVHHVTEGMDEGPIIAQAAVPVLTGDTEATLATRVLKVEHKIYAHALRHLIEGRNSDQEWQPLFSPPL